MTEQCNATKNNGEGCSYPAKYDDGKCGIHTEETEDTDPGGRPSKYSEERATQAIEAAEEGKSKSGCARAAGVPQSTLQDWLNADYMYEGDQFPVAFARARAKGETKLLSGGLYDPDVDSSMAKFLLASSFDYVKAEKREMEHSGEGGGPVEVTVNRERYEPDE